MLNSSTLEVIFSLRLVIIKEGKLLTEYNRKKDFYFYIGGHLEYGETILEGCEREVEEECGEGTDFKLELFNTRR